MIRITILTVYKVLGLIVFIVFGIYAYVKLKQLTTKLPQIKPAQQRLKFTIEMLFNLIPVGLIIIAFALTKDDILHAWNTVIICSSFAAAAILWDGLFIKYLEAESDLREKAMLQNEIEARKDVV